MSTYVISDIHGCYDEFIDMLEYIRFSKEDKLILAGDYIDRGEQNIEILTWLQESGDNVITIKGNHDAEFSKCIQLLKQFIDSMNIKINNTENLLSVYNLFVESYGNKYFDYYGTLKEIIHDKVSLENLIRWKLMIDAMPYYYKIKVNNKKYVVSHAGYITNSNFNLVSHQYESKDEFCMYAREESIRVGGIKDCIMIFGHTPTIANGIYNNNGNVYKHYRKDINCMYYNIDCGIAYGKINSKLACIRLDDEKIYYV